MKRRSAQMGGGAKPSHWQTNASYIGCGEEQRCGTDQIAIIRYPNTVRSFVRIPLSLPAPQRSRCHVHYLIPANPYCSAHLISLLNHDAIYKTEITCLAYLYVYYMSMSYLR